MRKIIAHNEGQVFGPFKHITEMEDRYRADGIDYPKSECQLVEAEELPSDFANDTYKYENGALVKITPPPIKEPVPEYVTMRQARLALLAIGKLAEVNAAIDAYQGVQGEAVRIEWDYSSAVYRDRPLVKTLAQAFGWDDAALDTLFIQANKL